DTNKELKYIPNPDRTLEYYLDKDPYDALHSCGQDRNEELYDALLMHVPDECILHSIWECYIPWPVEHALKCKPNLNLAIQFDTELSFYDNHQIKSKGPTLLHAFALQEMHLLRLFYANYPSNVPFDIRDDAGQTPMDILKRIAKSSMVSSDTRDYAKRIFNEITPMIQQDTAARLYCCVWSLDSGLMTIRQDASLQATRFFKVVSCLPIEMQMLVCNVYANSKQEFVRSEDFKKQLTCFFHA